MSATSRKKKKLQALRPGEPLAGSVQRLELALVESAQAEGAVQLCVDLRVDGVAAIDLSRHAVSLEALAGSAEAAGAYFIVTCDCGVAECAGIQQPASVRHSGGQIGWCLSQPQAFEAVFDAAQYREALQALLAELRERRQRARAQRCEAAVLQPPDNQSWLLRALGEERAP